MITDEMLLEFKRHVLSAQMHLRQDIEYNRATDSTRSVFDDEGDEEKVATYQRLIEAIDGLLPLPAEDRKPLDISQMRRELLGGAGIGEP